MREGAKPSPGGSSDRAGDDMSTKLTVAIPTRNRAASLRRLLSSLSMQTRQPDEIIIVDASDRGLAEWADDATAPVIWIGAREPNLPLQRWQAVERASGDIIAFFDDDTVPAPNYLELLLGAYASHSQAGGVCGWLDHQPAVERSGNSRLRLMLSGVQLRSAGVVQRGGLLVWWSEAPGCDPIDVPCLSGPCMSYRASILRQVGPQPWLYDLYRLKQGRAEDAILSALVRRTGYRLVLHPSIRVVHYGGERGSAYARTGYGKGMADTWSRYLCSRLLADNWTFQDQLTFLRYAIGLVASTTVVRHDVWYALGALSGIRKCVASRLPFSTSQQRGRDYSRPETSHGACRNGSL